MSMIASDNGGQVIPKLENGVYTAVSSAIIDLGLQESKQYGKTQRKFMLVWTILGEEIEVNEEKQPRVISKEYSFSLNEKSTLRKDLQAWRGKTFTEEELRAFNILTILNKPCQLQIILEEKGEKRYNNIAGIMSLPKGTEIQKLEDTYYFDMEDMDTWDNYQKVSNWIQEKIKRAKNLESTGFDKYIKNYEEALKENADETEITAPEDDLPF